MLLHIVRVIFILLEVLILFNLLIVVHELGHFLGASHSPENSSVMRPVLGDNRAGKTGFRIRFDPVNTLIMSLVSEEMRRNNAQDLAGMTVDTKRRLRQIYGELARTFPDDPASQHFVSLMETSGRVPLAAGAKQVLNELSRAALANTRGQTSAYGQVDDDRARVRVSGVGRDRDASLVQRDGVWLQRANRLGQDAMQVGAVKHEVRRAESLDAFVAEIEPVPGFSGAPVP